jgi:hypothetical protein
MNAVQHPQSGIQHPGRRVGHRGGPFVRPASLGQPSHLRRGPRGRGRPSKTWTRTSANWSRLRRDRDTLKPRGIAHRWLPPLQRRHGNGRRRISPRDRRSAVVRRQPGLGGGNSMQSWRRIECVGS